MHVARLQMSGVRGFYGDRSVDLDFTRPDGSLAGWTVLAGRNGSGKSTILQALALALAGPRATTFVPSLTDWISAGSAASEVYATLRLSGDDEEIGGPTMVPPETWLRLDRPAQEPAGEPAVQGNGIAAPGLVDKGYFYVGYGPFRHLGMGGSWRPRRSAASKLAQQVASLFDETVPLSDAVDWLIEQHLYQLEDKPGAANLLEVMMTLLRDGLLPDGFQVRRVDSDGLWISNNGNEFPLREMSDGYRAVTALVVDIVRQMSVAYQGKLRIESRDGTPMLPYSGVILIDEVDAHLHVSWQKAIGAWLKNHFPEIQFIVTTHSPYVCQSADPAGLIRLPGPAEHTPPRVIDEDLYERVVYGSGDDAIVSELFGVDVPYSAEAAKLRSRLADLETKVLGGMATVAEKEEYRHISETLTSSLSTRVDEIATRLRREQ